MIKSGYFSRKKVIESRPEIPREILKNSTIVFYNNKVIKFKGYPTLIGEEIDFHFDSKDKIIFTTSTMKSRLLESKLVDEVSVISFVSNNLIRVRLNPSNEVVRRQFLKDVKSLKIRVVT